MRLKYILLAVLMVNFFAIQSTYAQIKVTNEDGDKIILLPDGTWRYADDNKQANASQEVKANQKSGKTKVNPKKLTKAEKQKLKEIEKNKKRSAAIRKKLAKQKQEEAKKEKERLEKEAKKQAKLAKQQEKKQKNNKSKSSKKKNSKVAENTKKGSNSKSKKPKTTKKNTSKSNKQSKRLADKAGQPTSKKPNKKMQAKLVKQQFKPFKTFGVVKYEPECSYSMNEIDPFTQQKKIAVESSFFFGYTHPKLEEFLRGEHYLTAFGHVSEVGALKAFNLKFIVDSDNAQEDYGSILEGSRLLIKLLDGSTITLVSKDEDGGRIDRSKKQTIYNTYYILDGRNEKKLRKSEISQIRMYWSEGYEDYEIYEVDFIINQLNCLDNASKK